MSFLWIYLAVTLTLYGQCQGHWDPDKEAKMNEFIESLMACRDSVGLFVSLVKDGEVDFTAGYGYRDLGQQLPVTTSTRFNIGSLSKAFTATLAAEALSRNPDVTWDTPLQDILGEDFLLQDDFRTQEASIRDMFSHMMGMPSYWGVSTAGLNVTREEMVMNRMQHFPVSRSFRQSYLYSNYLYMIGSYATELIGGQPWEEHIYDAIFNPLGMNDSRISVDMSPEMWDNTVYSYTQYGEEFLSNPEQDQRVFLDEIGPSAAVFTTAEDMAQWMLFHLNEGKNNEGEVVVPYAQLRRTYEPSSAAGRESPKTNRPTFPVDDMSLTYGMGWRNGLYRGYEKIHHTGSYSSYNCYLRLLPEMEAGAASCVSSPGDSRGSRAVYLATAYGMDLILDEEPWLNVTTACTYPSPWTGRTLDDDDDDEVYKTMSTQTDTDSECPKTKPTTFRPYSDYAGDFSHPAFGDFHVELDDINSNLTYHFGMLLSGDLNPSTEPDVFHMTLNHPLTYRMTFFPQYPNGFPIYFSSSDGRIIDTVRVPYLEFNLPPTFIRS